ncbi:hypothetical protein B0H65DRAFT_208142 [Neurospora tetraspora]|uniref:Uncharacterized protein n=1 Tax=Neurospora tetraspora TaxID=94610 RepID=A0AAE0JFR7_9PEZI|nr:hypothetical protein B0H65DRAFT_208142 [Neurospora tetraspora]
MQFITLLRPERRVNVAARMDLSPPALCYSSCNDAYLEARDVGKSPSLCSDNSHFMRSYKECYSCVVATAAEDPREAVNAYLDPTFSQYISYCREQKNIDPSWYKSTTTWAIATYTNQNGPIVTVTVLVDTTVLRPDWTGFHTTTSMSHATTTANSSPQASNITSSQPLTTTNPTPDEPSTREATHSLSP